MEEAFPRGKKEIFKRKFIDYDLRQLLYIRKYFQQQHTAATKIQRQVRLFLKKRREERKLKSVSIIKKCVRRWLSKRKINEMKREKDRQTKEEHVRLIQVIHFLLI